jgi:UDP-glucose 4-epimerase
MDLSEGHVAALDLLSKATGWHAINLGTGKGYSVFEMVNAFEKASGHKVPYRVASRRPGDVAECYAKPQKANEVLHWTAKRSLDDMCASTWNFQKSLALNSH